MSIGMPTSSTNVFKPGTQGVQFGGSSGPSSPRANQKQQAQDVFKQSTSAPKPDALQKQLTEADHMLASMVSQDLQCRQFTHGNAPEAFALAKALRQAVFVKEQGVAPELEWDEFDTKALHWLLIQPESGEPVATARLLSYQEACQTPPVAKIGRVAVAQDFRGHRLGQKLMQEILAHAKAEGFQQAILDAQTRAIPFYERLGFVKEGFEFMDAGIPHYRMRLVFN